MRAAVLLLLAVNAGVAVWGLWLQPPLVQPGPPPAGGELTLLREGGEQAQGDRCAILEPPLATAAALRVAEKLRGDVRRVAVLREAGEAVYQVYLPPRKTLAQARDDVQALRVAGFTGARLAVGSGLANAVALGSFSKPTSARGRRDAVARLGYEAAIRELGAGKRASVQVRAGDLPDAPDGRRWRTVDCEPRGR